KHNDNEIDETFFKRTEITNKILHGLFPSGLFFCPTLIKLSLRLNSQQCSMALLLFYPMLSKLLFSIGDTPLCRIRNIDYLSLRVRLINNYKVTVIPMNNCR